MENNYDFRRTLLRVHPENLRDADRQPDDDELVLDQDTVIRMPAGAGRVLRQAALDLQDYLFTSMAVSVRIQPYGHLGQTGPGELIYALKDQNPVDLGDGDAPKGWRIDCSDRIVITGYDEAGAMQGGFWLEDRMSLRQAPFARRGTCASRPLFSPRMIHSGYGEDQYPDAHLAAIAHAGMDAILVTVKGVNRTMTGTADFNELCYRAAAYGLDVYAYSYLPADRHPDDPDAADYYEQVFGQVFRQCPAFRGIVLVGEAAEFPSKDERTSGNRFSSNSGLSAVGPDGLPTDKPSTGFFPCRDYPQWLALIRDTVRRHKPDADIVFWTYNWGCQPEPLRLEFIRNMPPDISLLVTFEMFELIKAGGLTITCADYTLMFPGPGRYFLSEARAAKERGIRLYAMANTGGLTWDIGVIPYEPAPFQWIRRYEGLLDAHAQYGLCGLMESHLYGFWPSFISELAKAVFQPDQAQPEEILRDIAARDFAAEQTENVLQAWRLWSEGIGYYRATNEDQYGPFRIGPAYPFVLFRDVKIPDSPFAHFGSRICQTRYAGQDMGRCSLFSFRIHEEIDSLTKMRDRYLQGADLLDAVIGAVPEKKRTNARKMANLGRFIGLCAQTAIHIKRWFLQKERLVTVHDRKEAVEIMAELRKIAGEEIENARQAIPLVRFDSRLGWEASMEYLCDEEHLNWKIRQVSHVLDHELPLYMSSLSYNDD